MKKLLFEAPEDYKEKFKDACKYLRLTQREVFLNAMGKVIKDAEKLRSRREMR